MEAGEEGIPQAVQYGHKLPVEAIRDEWRIDDEWWREPISRRYFQVILSDGRCATLYQDLVTRLWYRQNY